MKGRTQSFRGTRPYEDLSMDTKFRRSKTRDTRPFNRTKKKWRQSSMNTTVYEPILRQCRHSQIIQSSPTIITGKC